MLLLLSKATAPPAPKGPGPEDPVGAERAIGTTVYRTLKKIARDLPDEVLATLDAAAIVRRVPWDKVGEDLMEIAVPLEKVIKTAAREEIPKSQLAKAVALPIDGDPLPIEFAIINQLAVQYAAQHSGSLVMEISAAMRESIATIVSSNVAGTLPRDAVVKLLRSTIPLHSAWAETVTKVYDREYVKQIAAGTDPTRAIERASKVSDVRGERLLQARSKNIARTEAMQAMNEGKFAGWSQQIGDGWMPVDSLKEWQEGRSPCKQCAPLVGEIVVWDQPFSNGQMMPPEHPSCRCSAILLPPDDEFLDRMVQQEAEPVKTLTLEGLTAHFGAVTPRSMFKIGTHANQNQGNWLYDNNCSRVTTAMELRARGVKVTGGQIPANAAGASFDEMSDLWSHDGVPPVVERDFIPDALEAMLAEGDGARFYVGGNWDIGGSHVWNAEVVGGKLRWWDGQTDAQSRYDGLNPDYGFRRHLDEDAGISWFRVDNAEPLPEIMDWVEGATI